MTTKEVHTIADVLEPNEELFAMAVRAEDFHRLPLDERHAFEPMKIRDIDCMIHFYRFPEGGKWTMAQRWIPHGLNYGGEIVGVSLLIDKVPLTDPPRVAPSFPCSLLDRRH